MYSAGTLRAVTVVMSKRSKRSKSSKRSVGIVDRSATTDIVTQLECAVRNPHAAAIGAMIGGIVPWFACTLAHGEIQDAWGDHRVLAVIMIAVVMGCALFSALTVYKFGRAAFGDARKAIGFVLAMEGVMLVSHGATSTAALAALILINALANGSVIAMSRDATKRRAEADARRSATRARNRAAAQEKRATEPAEPATTPVAVKAPSKKHAPGLVLVGPSWRRPKFEDATDAEIVSETMMS